MQFRPLIRKTFTQRIVDLWGGESVMRRVL